MRVIIVVALIGAACAVPRRSNRIVGGESTAIENYPFMAGMIFIEEKEFIPVCGGTLITNTAVVSGAHCFMDDPPILWQVRLGSAIGSSGGIVHTISRIIAHKKFNIYTFESDVAVLKLTKAAVFSAQIKPARIAGPGYILPDHTPVHVIGWGATEWNGGPPEDLQHVEVNIINHQLCTDRYAYLKTRPETAHVADVTPDMLCTGILDVGGKDACSGDSGGPVIHNKDVLVGITSWGHFCADPIYPGVNVRVSSYTDWIYTNSIN